MPALPRLQSEALTLQPGAAPDLRPPCLAGKIRLECFPANAMENPSVHAPWTSTATPQAGQAEPLDTARFMPDPSLYVIHVLPLRTRLRDTYRTIFFPTLAGLFALVSWWMHWPFTLLLGACIGMLPSLRLGTPARMTIAQGDRARIDAWLASRRHLRDERGWVPKLPRALYFDSQIVRYEGHGVIGPLITLRKLRATLLRQARVPA